MEYLNEKSRQMFADPDIPRLLLSREDAHLTCNRCQRAVDYDDAKRDPRNDEPWCGCSRETSVALPMLQTQSTPTLCALSQTTFLLGMLASMGTVVREG